MRTFLIAVSLPLALAACQFEAHVGGGGNPPPQTPVNVAPAPAPVPNGGTATPTPTPTPADGRSLQNPLAGVKIGAPNPPPPFDPRIRPQLNLTSANAAVPLVTNNTDFGSAKMDSDSLVGLVYLLPNAVDRLPDLNATQPTYRMFARTFAVGPQAFVGFNAPNGGAPRNSNFAVRYTGSFNVAKAGDYSLYLDSKEGSRLSIDGKVVIDNDGVHGRTFKNADFTWTEGAHTITLEYFAVTNDVALELFVAPKGVAEKTMVWTPQVNF
jgi:hypothetical protein